MIKQDDGVSCPNCQSKRCVTSASNGEQIGIVAGAVVGAACVVWTVLSSAGSAGRLLASPSMVSKASKVGLMIGDIFCGAQAGRSLGKYYDQAGETEISCMDCGGRFKMAG